VILGATSARGQITVGTFTTTAETNAYAPVSQAQYFDQKTLTNTSPATADVSDDWTGTNVGGTATTWHWIGASHIQSSTLFDPTSLTVTGAGSFSYDMTTTADFVDPIRSGGVYTPGGAADYHCYFTLEGAATYRARGQLSQDAVFFLGSTETGFIFNITSGGSPTRSVDLSGVIPAGHYEIRANTSLSMGQVSSGVNHRVASGSFADFNFTVAVPEPTSIAALFAIGAVWKLRWRR
jgi:hypothetical protein